MEDDFEITYSTMSVPGERLDAPGPYGHVAQGTLKTEQPVANGRVVAAGIAPAQRLTSRPRREHNLTKVYTLADFPPGECEVLTPRVGTEEALTWLPVVAHKVADGCLVVRNEDGDEERLTINIVNTLSRRGMPVKQLKRSLFAEPERRVVPRVEEPAAPAAEPGPSAEEEEDEEAEADAAAGATDLDAQSSAFSLAEALKKQQEKAKKDMDPSALVIKEENEKRASGQVKETDEHTLALQAARKQALTEPDGETPLVTFRRGCSKKGSITNVLGGCGARIDRFVANDKILPDGHVLIKKGELYISAQRAWNFFAPSYPGEPCAFFDDFDEWMDDKAAELGWTTPQREFHLFVETANTKTVGKMAIPSTAWMGKSALAQWGKGNAGTGLYCGKYVKDDDGVEEFRTFTQLPECTQQVMAWWDARDTLKLEREQKRLTGHASPTEIKKLADELLEEKINADEKHVLIGYKQVSYDERLYEECKKANAANGVVDLDDLNPVVG